LWVDSNIPTTTKKHLYAAAAVYTKYYFLPFSNFSNDMMLHIEQISLFVYVSSYRELIAQSKTTSHWTVFTKLEVVFKGPPAI